MTLVLALTSSQRLVFAVVGLVFVVVFVVWPSVHPHESRRQRDTRESDERLRRETRRQP